MRRRRVVAILLAVMSTAGCGGGAKQTTRALTPAESAVCQVIPATAERLGAIDLDGHNAALGIPSRGLRAGVGALVGRIDAVAAESDSPLRKPMLSFRSAASHIGDDYVDDDDVIAMIKAAISAQGICEQVDKNFIPKPGEVEFPNVACSGTPMTVIVKTEDSFAFTEEDGYSASLIAIEYGDLTGDGYPDIVGSIACQMDEGDDSFLSSVVVVTRSRQGPRQLGQTLRGTLGKPVDGALQVQIEAKDGSPSRRLYELVDSRWKRKPAS